MSRRYDELRQVGTNFEDTGEVATAWVMRGLLERAGFAVREDCWAPAYADYQCSL